MEIFRDCQRNHACNLDGYAIDGCSEFIPNSTVETHCNTCGCHKNYHRKATMVDLEESTSLEHGGQSQSGGGGGGGGGGKSPSLSLRAVKRIARQANVLPMSPRFPHVIQKGSFKDDHPLRSKFSDGQREAMRLFSESLGWSMKHKDRQMEINMFCEKISVSKPLFKTWLNNNKKIRPRRAKTAAAGANSSSSKIKD